MTKARTFKIPRLVAMAIVAPALATLAGSSPQAPNDPYFPQQWALHNDGTQTVQQDLDDLHTLTPTGTAGMDVGWLETRDEVAALATHPVVVAVIDSGIDPTHPDLQGRIANGGKDFLTGGTKMSDPMGHGTHVSGIVAATPDNGVGIAGITPSTVQVLPLRILSDDFQNFAYKGKLVSDYAAQAINYAVSQKVDVINMSLGWPQILDTPAVRNAAQAAINAGILFVAAAGNDRKDEPTYPCRYEGVICVGATTNTGASAYFTDFGGAVDVMAPGDWVFSTFPQNVETTYSRIQGYEYLTGTSQASPHVAGLAAILKSAYPTAPASELRARILLSGGMPPASGDALYGLVNIKRALEAQPVPVYVPDFKALEEIPIDESSLTISGELSVQNLWAAASGVQAQISINGVAAGQASAAQLASGGSFTIPWKYTFASLDDSSVPTLTLTISDSVSQPRQFSTHLYAVRDVSKMSQQTSFTVPGINSSDWIQAAPVDDSLFYSKLSLVSSYPKDSSLPRYYQIVGAPSASAPMSVRIFDPSAANPVATVAVPNILRLTQVIRLDADGSGKTDWLFTGLGEIDQQHIYYQFYFLDSNFQPLWGNQSTWQVALDARFGQAVIRDYSAPGSWIHQGKRNIPAFLAQGPLPDPDNYDELDMRHYQGDTHLYYLSYPGAAAPAMVNPTPSPSPGASPGVVAGAVQLTLRALDNVAFRANAPTLHIQNMIPPSPSDAAAGHLRLLLATGPGLSSPVELWDIRSPTDHSTSGAPAGWDTLSSTGQPYPSAGASSAGYMSMFDDTTGTVAWADSTGQFLGHGDFGFKSVGNGIQGFVGTFDLTAQGLGRFWFIESLWDLVGYHQTGTESPQPVTLPLEHDTSFVVEEFKEMLTPVLVGTSAHPLPGVYIDSTLVHGNRVSVGVLNPATEQMERPLRYSLEIPAGCLQMPPNALNSTPESFVIPMLCKQGTQVLYRAVRPQN